jgi:pimeloyl-ACP methyl ester carboxylesterase
MTRPLAIAAAGLGIVVLGGGARGVRAQAIDPACVASFDESLATASWDHAFWTGHFGRPLLARAPTAIARQERLPFRFYHFGRPDGAPLVMLMGHGQSMLSWDPLILARYAECFDVYIFDNLGIGRSAFRGGKTRVAQALAALDFDAMADWVVDAVNGIRTSHHCRRSANHCNIVGTAPYLLGWAMGGKVAGVAAERHPGAFADLLNLGGHIARSDDISEGNPLGPNPDAVALVGGDDLIVAARTAFFVNPAEWGTPAATAAITAALSFGARALPHIQDPSSAPGTAAPDQKAAQERATEASVNNLEAIGNRILVAYGTQDDYNFCYTGDLAASVCARSDRLAHSCTANGVSGCLWGLGPLDDYVGLPDSAYERLAAGITPEVCLRGFAGSHAFPGQSQRDALAAVVDFIDGNTSGPEWTCTAGALSAP